MTPLNPRLGKRPAAIGSLLSLGTLCLASFAMAADEKPPIDQASEQVSVALSVLKDVKVGNRDGDDHLEKARGYLARARAELLKAQAQGRDTPAK
jgi:hypothetical protein